jgi:hypothetical protein
MHGKKFDNKNKFLIIPNTNIFTTNVMYTNIINFIKQQYLLHTTCIYRYTVNSATSLHCNTDPTIFSTGVHCCHICFYSYLLPTISDNVHHERIPRARLFYINMTQRVTTVL